MLATAPAGERASIAHVEAGSRKLVLKDVAILPVIMLACYLAMILFFRRRGGYAPVGLRAEMAAQGRFDDPDPSRAGKA